MCSVSYFSYVTVKQALKHIDVTFYVGKLSFVLTQGTYSFIIRKWNYYLYVCMVTSAYRQQDSLLLVLLLTSNLYFFVCVNTVLQCSLMFINDWLIDWWFIYLFIYLFIVNINCILCVEKLVENSVVLIIYFCNYEMSIIWITFLMDVILKYSTALIELETPVGKGVI